MQLIENPVLNGKIRLSYEGEFSEIDFNMYNTLGHQVNIENKISKLDDEIQIDVDGLKRGVYFIKLIYKDRSKTIKAVIN